MAEGRTQVIADGLAAVRERMSAACRRAGRAADGVTLVAVSKQAPIADVLLVAGLGQRHFGENRMQDAVAKVEAARDAGLALDWHLVGHLQTNKVRQAVGRFAMIQSVDSRHLAEAISRRCVFLDVSIPVLLEVNIAADPLKHGFLAGDVARDYPFIHDLAGLDVRGLMTVATQVDSADAARPHFAAMRDLRGELSAMAVAEPLEHLSMGMSSDYEVAIEEGATIVRVGTAIFGPRPTGGR